MKQSKRIKMPKVLSLLLIAAMMVALSGCSGNGNSGNNRTDQSSSNGDTNASNQPVTLNVWMPIGNKGVNGVHDDPIMQQLTKDIGVKINFTFFDKADSFNAKLASGELPDIIIAARSALSNGLTTLIKGGHLIDMKPLLQSNGQALLKDTPGKLKFSEKFLSNNTGKLYYIPTWDQKGEHLPVKSYNNGPPIDIAFFLNWNVYKQVGYPAMTKDMYSIIPILKKMEEAHPKTKNGKKVYGFSPWFADWDLWNFTVLTEAAHNVDAEQAKFVDIPYDGGPITSQINDKNSTLWDGAKFWNKANQAGILDPDSFTQKYGQYYDKMKAGQVLATVTRWAANKNFEAVKLPSNITKWGSEWYNPYADRWFMGITTDSNHPKKAMDLINFINSAQGMRLLMNGIQGKNWHLVKGVPRLTSDTLNTINNGTSAQKRALGFGEYSALYGRDQYMWDSKYNAYMQYQLNEPVAAKAAKDPTAQDYDKHYNVDYPDQVFTKSLPDTTYKADGSFLNMVDPTPDNIKQIDDRLDHYLQTQLLKAVMAKSDADFNKIQNETIAQAKKMGSETAFQWHKNNYNKARSKVKSFDQSLSDN